MKGQGKRFIRGLAREGDCTRRVDAGAGVVNAVQSALQQPADGITW
jgi:hypothetical protein